MIDKGEVFKILALMHLVCTNRTDEFKEGYNQALSDAMKHLRKLGDERE